MNKIIITVFFLLTAYLFSFGQKASLGNQYFHRTQCIEDITQLQKTLTQYHPSLYTYTSKKDLQNKFNTYIYSLPDSINSYQFHTDLTLLINQVRDGHLYLSTNQTMNHFEIQQGHLLPFSFRIFDYKLFIQSNYGDSSVERWDVVTKINGVPSTELIYELLPMIPTDGYCSSRKLKLLEENFSLLYSRKYGFSTSFEITIISKSNLSKPSKHLIKGVKTNLLIEKSSEKKQSLFFEIDKTKSRAYLKVPSFNSYKIEHAGIDWSKWLKNHFNQLKSDSIQSLILDLRGNEGGNVLLMSELIEYLLLNDFQLYQSITINNQLLKSPSIILSEKQTKKLKKQTVFKNDSSLWNEKFTEHYYFPKKAIFSGKLFVLMDGGTYSSASHAVQLLQQRQDTKFYGEETGGNGVSSNAGKTVIIKLENSNFNLHLPLMKGLYKTKKVFSSTSGILPDKYCGNELLMELKYSDICLLEILEDIVRKK